MSDESIEDWEARMLREHDLGDLAGCVQLLRMLNWNAALSLETGSELFVWHKNPDEFEHAIEQLRRIGMGDEDATRRTLAMSLARLYVVVRDALAAGPRRPSEEEVVRRYVAGEIGDRTARYVLGVDAWGLIDACHRHGLPPIQIGDDE